MLALRPLCENCGIALPPDSLVAMICSFECTFCVDCVTLLRNVCPNCGGGFTMRPIRPAHDWKGGNCLAENPATAIRLHRPVDLAAHDVFADSIEALPPERR